MMSQKYMTPLLLLLVLLGIILLYRNRQGRQITITLPAKIAEASPHRKHTCPETCFCGPNCPCSPCTCGM